MTTGIIYLRNPSIAATEIDEETFIVELGDGEVFYLDVGPDIDWDRLVAQTREGWFWAIIRGAFGLFHQLGLGADRMPGEFSGRIGGLPARALDRLVKDFEIFFTAVQNAGRVLERDYCCALNPA